MFHVKQIGFSIDNVLSECGFQTLDNAVKVKEKLSLYLELVKRWNVAINLVGSSTLDDGWKRHVLDSAQLLPHIYRPDQKKTVLDLGSGAGFPGMVLAIVGGCKVTLVEANARKCRFLEEVAAQTQTAVDIVNARVEDLEPWTTDFVVSRAMASLTQLLAYSFPFCAETSQCLFLKGGDVSQEIEQAHNHWFFDVELFESKTSCQGRVIRVKHIRKRC